MPSPSFYIFQEIGLEDALDSPTLPRLEEFYISFIQSQKSAKGNHFETNNILTEPKQIRLSTAVSNSTPAVVDSPRKESASGRFTYICACSQLTCAVCHIVKNFDLLQNIF